MDLLEIFVTYINHPSPERAKMADENGHSILLPAVPRVGEELFLPTTRGIYERFRVHKVKWFSWPRGSEPSRLRRQRVEMEVIYFPED
jgi:hypothetical protein